MKMHEWEKSWITENWIELLDSVTINPQLIDLLCYKHKTISVLEAKELKRTQAHVSYGDYETKSTLLNWLQTRFAYDALYQVLTECLQHEASLLLQNGKRKEMARKLEDEDAIKIALDFIKNTERLKIVVKQPDTGYINREDDFYKLKPMGMRRALLINIMRPQGETRHGSDVDMQYMTELLGMRALGFEVFPIEKEMFTTNEFIKEIDDFRSACNKDEVDTCLVFVASHGSFNRIFLNATESAHIYEDIVYKFSHDELAGCPGMKGRPKIFMFQVCQTYLRARTIQTQSDDISDLMVVSSNDEANDNNLKNKSESYNVPKKASAGSDNGEENVFPPPYKKCKVEPSEDSKDHSPGPHVSLCNNAIVESEEERNFPFLKKYTDSKRDIKDAIVILPQVPGGLAHRDYYRGTFFVFIFSYVVMNLAYDMPLNMMLEKVQDLVYRINSTADRKQLPVFLNLGFKTMYFFPRKK